MSNIDFDSDLTIQQQAFVAEYIVDFNAGRAAIAAKYSKKSGSSLGSQLLKNPKIQIAIREALREQGTQREILKERILNQLCNLAFSDIRDYLTFDDDGIRLNDSTLLTRAQAAAITEVRESRSEKGTIVTFKLAGKDKPLEMLSRHLGMLTEDTGAPATRAEVKTKTFKEFCVAASYPEPLEKQIEIMEYVINGGPEKIEKPRLLLGARAYGKTIFSTIAGLAYKIYLEPAFTCLIITKVEKNGRRILREISRCLKANGVGLEVDNADEIRVKGLTGNNSSVMITTVGSSGLRSLHPKLVIFDDPVVPGSVSEVDREQLKTCYSEAIKLCKNIALIGQPVDFRDLYQYLRNIIETMEVPYGSIPQLDDDLDVQRAAGVDEKSIQASYFLKVDPEGDASFHDIHRIENFPTSEGAYAFIDPADGGDYTALGGFTSHFQGMAIVGKAFKKAWHVCIPEIKEFCIKYNVKKLGFETNMFGTQPLQVLREALSDIGVSVEGKYTHTNKETRIQLASQYSKSLYLSKESDTEYTRQVVEYSHDAKYDDAPDTIATFLEWAGMIRPPKASKKPSQDL